MSVPMNGDCYQDFNKVETAEPDDTCYEDWKFEQEYEPVIATIYGEDC